jgi:hypothetical protein
MVSGFPRHSLKPQPLQIGERIPSSSSRKFAPSNRVGPRVGREAEAREAFFVQVPFIIIGLHDRPIVAPAPVLEGSVAYSELFPLDGFYPGGMREAEPLLSVHKPWPSSTKR